jgi:hypothetical protein
MRDSSSLHKIYLTAKYQWLTPVILATWEAEIGRIKVIHLVGRQIDDRQIIGR